MTRTPADIWEVYAAAAKPRRKVNAAGAATWLNWTQYPDHGPDEAVLGSVRGKQVVEIGSGSGANLAHLATLGAHCTGVDIAPTRTGAAVQRWGDLPNIEFVTADATAYLVAHPGRYDVVYSIFGAIWFTSPALLLPVVRDALVPGGLLAFSHLPVDHATRPVAGPVAQHRLLVRQWRRALDVAGLEVVSGEIIPAPTDEQLGTLLVRARRR